jgi:phosphonate transport system substrate-binding protein
VGARSAARSGGPVAPSRLSTLPPARRPLTRRGLLAGAGVTHAAALAGCGGRSSPVAAAGTAGGSSSGTLRISAIPDQDPQVLQRLYSTVADAMSRGLGVPVAYQPVTDYTAAVSLFRTGDLHLVFFGGLTGVQARLQTPGSRVLAQRDIDARFHSVFVVNRDTGIAPADDLRPLAGLRFTYGSETSTSGRLMPAWFLQQQGVDPQGFPGGPGFSGSHDATLQLVASGSYQAGVLNEQVWTARSAAGQVDPAVVLHSRTPAFHDYHWLLGPTAEQRFGAGFGDRVLAWLTGLSPQRPDDARVLQLYGAGSFLPAQASDHDQIEQVGRSLGLVR